MTSLEGNIAQPMGPVQQRMDATQYIGVGPTEQYIGQLPITPVTLPATGAVESGKIGDIDETGMYIGGEHGGIPTSVFASHHLRKGPLYGKSGRELFLRVNSDEVEIRTPERKVLFGAGVYNEVYSFRVLNRDAQGNREPDIYPAALVRASVNFFRSMGISFIEGNWFPPSERGMSVNYEEYTANLEALGKPPEEIGMADKKAAALSTWTGRLASSLGYDEVYQVSDGLELGKVEVLFCPSLQDRQGRSGL